MKPIYVKNTILPFGRFNAITLFPFVFYKGDLKSRTKRHEDIHFVQQIEMLVIPFYIVYLVLWMRYGYYRNPFEREAYVNHFFPDYLKSRERYSWTKYFNS